VTDQLVYLGSERIPLTEGDAEAGPFQDEDDFQYRGVLISNPPMDIYGLTAHPATTIAIEKKRSYWIGPHDPIDPEHALEALCSVPDPRLITRIRFVDGCHPKQPWLRQIAESDLTIEATSDYNGEIIVYNNGGAADLDSVIRHKWCRLLAFNCPSVRARFDQACKDAEFDEVGFLHALMGENWNVIAGGFSVLLEAWCWIGAKLLEGVAKSLSMVLSCPGPAAIFGEALASRLSTLPAELQGARHQEYCQIAEWLTVTIAAAARDGGSN
jgi:hypothetical protein